MKRDSKGRFVKGHSGNPTGRPKDDKAWASIIRDVGNMTTDEILEFIPKNNELGRAINKMPKGTQMKYLVTARVFTALMFEPTSGLWNGLMDRADGKVKDVIENEGLVEILVKYADGDRNDP